MAQSISCIRIGVNSPMWVRRKGLSGISLGFEVGVAGLVTAGAENLFAKARAISRTLSRGVIIKRFSSSIMGDESAGAKPGCFLPSARAR